MVPVLVCKMGRSRRRAKQRMLSLRVCGIPRGKLSSLILCSLRLGSENGCFGMLITGSVFIVKHQDNLQQHSNCKDLGWGYDTDIYDHEGTYPETFPHIDCATSHMKEIISA
eukprot:gb/GECG01000259.1/.p1 GENE.gb/GECG01000259.1/~~gb/GECG01000259.1/.p1  ORF type:complete len:112 (+),score=5.89 gb/GECG01000259.1/:1-336(+)